MTEVAVCEALLAYLDSHHVYVVAANEQAYRADEVYCPLSRLREAVNARSGPHVAAVADERLRGGVCRAPP